ncbi:MAG: hypothetical protein HY593_01820 [Candidatus Omnitrophica bacterium]|nr:hypothetical protein [Candidatus Omnitrophota bacterium]
MGIGESLTKGFSVSVRSGVLFFVLFIFGFVFNLINVLAFQNPPSPEPKTSTLVAAFSIGVVFILLSIYVQAGTLGYIRDRVKLGSVNFSTFFSSGAKYYVRLFLVGLLVALIVGALLVLAGLVAALLTGKLSVLGIALAILIAALGIYLVVLLFFAPYIVVAGDQPAWASIKQSVAFVRKNILPILGIAILLVLIGLVIGVLLGLISGLTAVAIKGVASQMVFAFLSSLVNAFLGILVTATFMNFYFGRTTGAAPQAQANPA